MLAGVGLGCVVLCLGGFGLPVSVPPQSDTPIIMKIAPADCLFYANMAGSKEATSSSENQTEQLLAEPKVQEMLVELERTFVANAREVLDQRGITLPKEAVAGFIKALLTRPAAAYISKIDGESDAPVVHGGVVIKLGDDAAVKKTFESIAEQLVPKDMKTETVEIADQEWQQISPSPGQKVTWGVRGQYFIVSLGDGEIEAMLKRARGDVPDWLAAFPQDFPIDRFSSKVYLNVKAIPKTPWAKSNPKVATALAAMGLNNITTIRAASGLDQECFVHRIRFDIDGEPLGVFKLATGKPLAAEDFAGVPRSVNFVLAAKIDMTAVYDAALELLPLADENEKNGLSANFDRFKRRVGVDLREELVQSLGDTWIMHDSPGSPGVFATVSLREPQKFTGAYQKIMAELERSRGPGMLGVAKASGGGPNAYNVVMGPGMVLPIAWSVTGSELVFAFSPLGVSARSSRSGGDSVASAPELAAALNVRPAPLWLSYINIPGLFDQLYPMISAESSPFAAQLLSQGIAFDTDSLPPADTIRKHLSADVAAVRSTDSGLVFGERSPLPGIGVSSLPSLMAAILLPAVQASREAARCQQTTNNMKQIGLALQNYVKAKGTLPPAYTTAKDGKPLLSWRVAILPFLPGGGKLYKQFHLDEPWDSKHNMALAAKMPEVYQAPGNVAARLGKTNYLAPRGKSTLFPGAKGIALSDISDGPENTATIFEVANPLAVVWTKPDDLECNKKDPLKALLGLRNGGFFVLLADGSVRFLSATTDAQIVAALFTRSGSETAMLPE